MKKTLMQNLKHINDFSYGQEFFDYWINMPRRVDGQIPYRNDFEPGGVVSLLPHVFVGEAPDQNTYKIRLVGTWIENFVGKARPHDNVYDNYTKKEKQKYNEFINKLLAQPCVGYMDRDLILSDNNKFSFKTVFCPFNDENGDARFIIGVSHLKDTKRWHTDDFVKLLKKNVFNRFEYIDIGFGTPNQPK